MAEETPRRALIIGAGPGGLSAAIALHRVGIDTAVFERASKIGTVGGGLGVQSNAMRALMRLGIGDRLVKAGSEIRVNEIHNAAGKLLFALPQGEVADDFGTPTIMVLRSEVQLALADALEPGVLRLGRECVGVEQDPDGVTAHFSDGSSERGALLVGADGGQSIVRRYVYGGEGNPLRYSGLATWRGVLEHGGHKLGGAAKYYNGAGQLFCMFPVGEDRIYWGVMNAEPSGGKDPSEGLLDMLCDLMRGFPDVTREVISATKDRRIARTDLYDRDPDDAWVKGRVVLLGDSAHLTTPFIGQGAGIAMEDSVVLAKELALTDGLRDQEMLGVALEFYQHTRAPRCAKVIMTSRRRGKVYLMTNPALTHVRDRALRLLPHAATREMVRRSIVYEV